jgi:hypothetical protein
MLFGGVENTDKFVECNRNLLPNVNYFCFIVSVTPLAAHFVHTINMRINFTISPLAIPYGADLIPVMNPRSFISSSIGTSYHC